MSYAIVPGRQSNTTGSLIENRTITASAANQLTCAAGTFLTTGGVPGDAVEIAGTAGSNGIYIVTGYVSNTVVNVYPAIPAFAGAVGGTCNICVPGHELTITDEASPTCASIAAAMASLLPAFFFRVGGASDLSTDNEDFDIYHHLCQLIAFTYTSASVSTFVSKREIIASYYDRRIVAGPASLTLPVGCRMVSKLGSLGSVALQFGELGGSGAESGRYGSILLHTAPDISFGSQAMSVQAYDTRFIGQSEWTQHYYGSNRSGVQGFLYGCTISGWNFFSGSQQLNLRRCQITVPSWNAATLASFAGALDIEDVTVTDTRNTAFTLSNVNHKKFRRMFFADGVVSPYFAGTSSSVTAEDFQQDIAHQTLFSASSGTCWLKRYTYHPRIVEVKNQGQAVAALSGVRVDIEKFLDAQYIQVQTGGVGTWSLVLDGVTVNVTGNAAAATVRNNIVTAINAAGLGVTAIAASNGSQTGGTNAVYITHNTAGRFFTLTLNTPPAGTWTLAYTKAGQLNLTPDDFFGGVISGSPFTSDSGGRINTTGVVLTRTISCESTFVSRREANVKYKVTLTKTGYETRSFFIEMNAYFNGDVAMRASRMGNLE